MNKILVLFSVILTLSSCKNNEKDYIKVQGSVFGTFYHIIYQQNDENNMVASIKKALAKVDNSLSTYNKTSTINKFSDSAKGCKIDSMMKLVYLAGNDVYKDSHGAFDMTVGALVNEWGFGFKKRDSITDTKIQELLSHIGMDKLSLKGDYLAKTDSKIRLDAAAIAKGFGVDVVADVLKAHGIDNYMVEIGGEIRVGGVNSQGVKWRVGIDKPIDDKSASHRELEGILSISETGLATSGNYRNFYIKDGKKYAHTINPATGYPVQHSLLSASIIAPKCMNADAYATACMVLGLEKSMKMLEGIPGVEGYFIYADKAGKNQIEYTPGFKKYISE